MDHPMKPAVQRMFARVAAVREQVKDEIVALDRDSELSESDRDDLAWTLYAIKQLTIDPDGVLGAIRHADERETALTARLYAAVAETHGEAIMALLDITEELMEDPEWYAYAEDYVDDVMLSYRDVLGELPHKLLIWFYAHSTVVGAFTSDYPASLLAALPTLRPIYQETRERLELKTNQDALVLAMELALVDLLMLPHEAGWQQIQRSNYTAVMSPTLGEVSRREG